MARIFNGKKRPLSIPTIKDRAMQALYKLALAPVAETLAVITYINKGFTFLGQTFRKHGRKLHIRPSTKGVFALVQKVGTLIRKHVSTPMPILIKKLNPTFLGWANYHRHVVASEAFSRVDTYVFEQLWRMVRQRHQNKPTGWLIRKYWIASGKKHRFAVKHKIAKKVKVYTVLRTGAVGIRRYVKIKADANPYLPKYAAYFYWRRHNKESKLLPAMSAREYLAMAA